MKTPASQHARQPRILMLAGLSAAVVLILFLSIDSSGSPAPLGGDAGRHPLVHAKATSPVTLAPTGSRQPSAALAYRAAVGRVLRFDLHLTRAWTIRSALGYEVAAPVSNSISLQATLQCVAYPAPSGGTLLFGYRLLDARHQTDRVGTDPELAARLAAQLAEEVMVETSMRGQIERVFFSPRMGFHARSEMVGVLETMQIVLPEEKATTWQIAETGLTGRFVAQYQASHEGDHELHITKSRTAYERSSDDPNDLDATPGGLLEAKPEDFAEAILDLVAGHLRSVQAVGRTTMTGLECQMDFSLILATRERDETVAALDVAAIDARLAEMEAAAPGEIPGAEERAAERRLERLHQLAEGYTVSGLVQRLVLITDPEHANLTAVWDTVQRLSAMVSLDETNVAVIADLLRQGQLPQPCRGHLTSALGEAGTAAAQSALSAMITDPGLPVALRTSCVTALIGTTHPTAIAEQSLRPLVDTLDSAGLGPTALLALGDMAHHMANYDAGRANQLTQFLLAREPLYTSAGATRVFLAALGNSGSAAAGPTLARYHENSDERVRATALAALRRMDRAVAATQVERALDDTSLAVRLTAIELIVTRVPSVRLLRAVRDTALHAPEVALRRAAIDCLGSHLGRAECRRALEDTLTTEADSGLRHLASELLRRS